MRKTFVEVVDDFFITQSTFEATNSGIMLNGKHAALIDPALTPNEIMAIAQFVHERGAKVETIFVTHSHWDHILGPAYFPDAHVIAHHLYAETVAIEERGLRESLATWERDAGIVRETLFSIPQPAEVIEEHEAFFRVGDQRVMTLHTPGHHRDLVVLYGYNGVLWASDMLSDLEIPFVEHNIAAYRVSLEELTRMQNVRVLIPGHGAWTTDQSEIRERIERDRAYLRALEEMVRASLTEGLTVEQTVEVCATIPIINPAFNSQAHRDNVELAWLEFGGMGDAAKLGWNKYYPSR